MLRQRSVTSPSVSVTALCNQPEAFASDLRDDQSRYLLLHYTVFVFLLSMCENEKFIYNLYPFYGMNVRYFWLYFPYLHFVVSKLLSQGISASCADRKLRSPLHIATAAGNEQIGKNTFDAK